MFPQYAVAAAARRVAPSVAALPGEVVQRNQELPVGTRHAVPTDGAGTLAAAVCGQDVTQWALFLSLPFTGSSPADCRRCAQIVRRTGTGAAPQEAT
jgi:hypothetical protein